MVEGKKLIDLRIGSLTNKGDALMLYAILQRLGPSYALSTLSSIADYQTRACLGLYQNVWVSRFDNAFGGIFGLVPARFRNRFGLVAERDIDSVLDARGFAYGDQWGPDKTKRLASLSKRWKKQGKKIVLLPQSLGPFRDPELKRAFCEIVQNVDLIFARDQVSLNNVVEIAGQCGHVKFAPDFTNEVRGIEPISFQPRDHQVCIIPNHRMVDSVPSDVGRGYLIFLERLCTVCFDLELDPFILIHEEADGKIALELQDLLNRDMAIVYDRDPRVLKGIIGKCHVVFSSRFHGLVSSLTQAVPTLATEWTHKFKMLLEQYGCADLLLSTQESEQEIKQKVLSVVEPVSRARYIETIKKSCKRNESLVNEMWREVERIISPDITMTLGTDSLIERQIAS